MDNLIKNSILLKNLNYNKIDISKNNIENGKRKNIILNYDNNYFILETPNLLVNNNDIKDNDNYYEIIIFLNKEDEFISLFIESLKKIDDKLKSIMINNKKLFNYDKKIKYKSILRRDNNNHYIKIKLLKEEIPNLKIIQNSQNINFEEIKNNNSNLVKLILNFNAIWINKNIFGVYVKPVKIEKIIIEENIVDNNTEYYESYDKNSYSDTSLSNITDIKKNLNFNNILISNTNSVSKNIKELNNNEVSSTSVTISSIKKNNINKLEIIEEKNISYSSTS